MKWFFKWFFKAMGWLVVGGVAMVFGVLYAPFAVLYAIFKTTSENDKK